MRIVILDGHTMNPGDLSWGVFEEMGEVIVNDYTPDDKVRELIGDAEIVLIKKASIDETIIRGCPRLRYIGLLATGTNIVDLDAARANGITVTNIPDFGTEAVAQHTFALLLELCHHVGHHATTVEEGRWGRQEEFCYWDYPLIELYGKTMGIVGFGRIGQTTARIAIGFGMKVLTYDKYEDKELESANIKYTGLDELLSTSDIISLNCPLTTDNKGMINRETIAGMKDGVIIVNTARGALINETDLLAALQSGKVAGAALDVLSAEPPKEGNILIGAPNCIITPHIAWAPLSARARIIETAANNLRRFLAGNPINVVN